MDLLDQDRSPFCYVQKCSFMPFWVTFSHRTLDALLSPALLSRNYFMFYILVLWAESWTLWTKAGWTCASCTYAVLCCCTPNAALPSGAQLSRIFPFLHGCATALGSYGYYDYLCRSMAHECAASAPWPPLLVPLQVAMRSLQLSHQRTSWLPLPCSLQFAALLFFLFP